MDTHIHMLKAAPRAEAGSNMNSIKSLYSSPNAGL